MQHVSRRPNTGGYTLLEVLIVIAVIMFLLAAIFGMATKMRERTKVTQSRKLVEMAHNAMETYRIDFRSYPPDTFGSYVGSEALVYFLTKAFRVTPNTAVGEVQASMNGGPYAKFNDVELRDLGTGRQSLVDAWGSPLKYKLETYTEADPWDASKTVVSYRVRLYSLGPNKVDDSALGDDILVGK